MTNITHPLPNPKQNKEPSSALFNCLILYLTLRLICCSPGTLKHSFSPVIVGNTAAVGHYLLHLTP